MTSSRHRDSSWLSHHHSPERWNNMVLFRWWEVSVGLNGRKSFLLSHVLCRGVIILNNVVVEQPVTTTNVQLGNTFSFTHSSFCACIFPFDRQLEWSDISITVSKCFSECDEYSCVLLGFICLCACTSHTVEQLAVSPVSQPGGLFKYLPVDQLSNKEKPHHTFWMMCALFHAFTLSRKRSQMWQILSVSLLSTSLPEKNLHPKDTFIRCDACHHNLFRPLLCTKATTASAAYSLLDRTKLWLNIITTEHKTISSICYIYHCLLSRSLPITSQSQVFFEEDDLRLHYSWTLMSLD